MNGAPDGMSFVGSIGSSVQTIQGTSTIAGADLTHNASVNVAFGGDTLGGFAATNVDVEVAGAQGQSDYKRTYNTPCTTTVVNLPTEVDVTNANASLLAMSGRFEGTVAIARGTKQCPMDQESDIAIVPLDGQFNLLWPGPR